MHNWGCPNKQQHAAEEQDPWLILRSLCKAEAPLLPADTFGKQSHVASGLLYNVDLHS